MENLLNSVDFAVDFAVDFDTSDLDYLSDDLLDTLNEDDLLNIDLLSEYEDLEESQELSDELLPIDSFFVQNQSETDFKTNKSDFKSINNITSFLISPFGLPNQTTQLNSLTSTSHHSSIGYLSPIVHSTPLNPSITHQLNYRSQSALLSKENSMTDDSYCSSDEDSISSIVLDDQETSLETGVMANRFGQDKSFDKLSSIRVSESSDVLARDQARSQTRFQSRGQQAKCQPKRLAQTKCRSAIYEEDLKPKRKLSSKGTSLLAKPKSPRKVSDSFARTFYQEHNYCFYL